MTSSPTISEAEWQVMRVVWTHAPAITASEIVAELAPTSSWNPRTIKTMLNRLVKKGALSFEPQGKRYLYRARVSQHQCIHSESRSFVDRVFGGAEAAMLNYFVQHTRLSRQEIEQLKLSLSRKEK